jgi:hypothetical protein
MAMTTTSACTAVRRADEARKRMASLRERTSVLLQTARSVVHDARNNRLEAQLLRRVRPR